MSATNSLHYQLCCEGAKYIIQPRAAERWQTPNKWATVELACTGVEECDVWATNGETSTIIEVKVSVSDFRNDRKKYARTEQAQQVGQQTGNFRYYLCPQEISDKIMSELPENWGLLIWNGKKVECIVCAKFVETNHKWDMFIMSSIMRRELGMHKIFNYRSGQEKGGIK